MLDIKSFSILQHADRKTLCRLIVNREIQNYDKTVLCYVSVAKEWMWKWI